MFSVDIEEEGLDCISSTVCVIDSTILVGCTATLEVSVAYKVNSVFSTIWVRYLSVFDVDVTFIDSARIFETEVKAIRDVVHIKPIVSNNSHRPM
jgi:hypothetical protein